MTDIISSPDYLERCHNHDFKTNCLRSHYPFFLSIEVVFHSQEYRDRPPYENKFVCFLQVCLCYLLSYLVEKYQIFSKEDTTLDYQYKNSE